MIYIIKNKKIIPYSDKAIVSKVLNYCTENNLIAIDCKYSFNINEIVLRYVDCQGVVGIVKI